MNPLGMLIARARGAWDFGPTINVLVMHYPDYLMVGVSLVISRVVTGLGQQVLAVLVLLMIWLIPKVWRFIRMLVEKIGKVTGCRADLIRPRARRRCLTRS